MLTSKPLKMLIWSEWIASLGKLKLKNKNYILFGIICVFYFYFRNKKDQLISSYTKTQYNTMISCLVNWDVRKQVFFKRQRVMYVYVYIYNKIVEVYWFWKEIYGNLCDLAIELEFDDEVKDSNNNPRLLISKNLITTNY